VVAVRSHYGHPDGLHRNRRIDHSGSVRLGPLFLHSRRLARAARQPDRHRYSGHRLARLCGKYRSRPDAERRGEPHLVAEPLCRHHGARAPRTPDQQPPGPRLRFHERLPGLAAAALIVWKLRPQPSSSLPRKSFMKPSTCGFIASF
jgi:hypothetical protein